VTSKTVAGVGAVQVPITASRTFTLTLSRGAETLSAQATVAAIDNIAQGWTLVDNFDRYPVGLLNGQGGWRDLDATDFSLVNVNGNMMVGANAGDATATLALGPLTVTEGQERTLFFRLYQVGDVFEIAKGMVALTDRNARFGSDVGAAGNDIGPGAVGSTEWFGALALGGYNPASASLEVFEPMLDLMTVYNVWVDLKNGPLIADPFANGDTYSIYVAKEGTAQRSTVLTDFASARGPGAADVGFATPDLNKLLLGGLNGTSATTNLFFDDIYLSKSGFLNTVPRAFGFTTPVEPPTTITVAIQWSGTEVQVSWSAGVLESTDNVLGSWNPVPGATTSPYTTTPNMAAQFYRAKQ
jgi:hypothetical protein